MITTQWSMSKGLDSSCPIGKWMEIYVTSTFGLYHSCMRAYLNRPGACGRICNTGSSGAVTQGNI